VTGGGAGHQPQAGEGGGHGREPAGLQQLAPDPIDGVGGKQVAGQRRDREDCQRVSGLPDQARVRGNQLDYERAGDRVAVVHEVERQPGQAGADQPAQHPLVGPRMPTNAGKHATSQVNDL
jgi:hypothetical protein